MLEYFLGSALTVVSLLVVFIAFPSQAYKNYKTKNFGISLVLVLFGMTVYMLRIPYTWIRRDYFILIPDVVGFLVHAFLIWQFFLYRKQATLNSAEEKQAAEKRLEEKSE